MKITRVKTADLSLKHKVMFATVKNGEVYDLCSLAADASKLLIGASAGFEVVEVVIEE